MPQIVMTAFIIGNGRQKRFEMAILQPLCQYP